MPSELDADGSYLAHRAEQALFLNSKGGNSNMDTDSPDSGHREMSSESLSLNLTSQSDVYWPGSFSSYQGQGQGLYGYDGVSGQEGCAVHPHGHGHMTVLNNALVGSNFHANGHNEAQHPPLKYTSIRPVWDEEGSLQDASGNPLELKLNSSIPKIDPPPQFRNSRASQRDSQCSEGSNHSNSGMMLSSAALANKELAANMQRSSDSDYYSTSTYNASSSSNASTMLDSNSREVHKAASSPDGDHGNTARSGNNALSGDRGNIRQGDHGNNVRQNDHGNNVRQNDHGNNARSGDHGNNVRPSDHGNARHGGGRPDASQDIQYIDNREVRATATTKYRLELQVNNNLNNGGAGGSANANVNGPVLRMFAEDNQTRARISYSDSDDIAVDDDSSPSPRPQGSSPPAGKAPPPPPPPRRLEAMTLDEFAALSAS
jgi:hypothetical protein